MPPLGRQKSGWKRDLLRALHKAGADLGNIREEEILSAVREYRSGRKSHNINKNQPFAVNR